jgi:hypothetical protein
VDGAVLFDHLSEPYTKTLLSAQTPLPAGSCRPPKGGCCSEGRWSSAVVREIDAALGRASAAAK